MATPLAVLSAADPHSPIARLEFRRNATIGGLLPSSKDWLGHQEIDMLMVDGFVFMLFHQNKHMNYPCKHKHTFEVFIVYRTSQCAQHLFAMCGPVAQSIPLVNIEFEYSFEAFMMFALCLSHAV